MSISRAFLAVAATSLVIALVIVACGGPTQADIVQTVTAEQKLANVTKTAEALIAQGLKPGSAAVAVGKGSLAEQFQQEFSATATAEAEAGETPTPTSEADAASTGSNAATGEITAPKGPVLSGEVEVTIGNNGTMDPEVIKIAPGTTVTWINTERSAHATASDPGQAEQWSSGDMSRKVTDKESKRFSHKFTIPGRYTYGSNISGDGGRGVVWVVEK